MMTSTETRSRVDRATFTITFERTFSASREQVFEAWTNPEQVKVWWDPTGHPLSECTIDLRPGGAFKFVNDGHHGPPFAGAYKVVERPSKLVFDALGAVGTVLIETIGARTRLVVSIRCASAEHLEQFVNIGVDAGTNQTLDNLVAYLDKAAN